MINKKYGISANQVSRYGFKLCLEVYEKYDRKCSECGALNVLCIHHIDGSGDVQHGNKNSNNSLDNLQLLCQSCRACYHTTKRWAELGKSSGIRMKDFPSRKAMLIEKSKIYNKKHSEKIKAYKHDYYLTNIDKTKKGMKEYAEKHRQELREYHRAYYLRKKEESSLRTKHQVK
jgi:hypothetical protein